jgi:hypothetical protein
MKPTSLSQEFYKKLYDEIICKYEFSPESTEDTSCYIEAEDFEGFFIELKATFEVNVIDDSFDHAFGTEHGWHIEAGELTDIEEVTMYDEDGNNVSKLFDYDAFWEQFKCYEVKFHSGTVIKSGDTAIAKTDRYRFEEVEFLYKNTLSGEYICKPIGTQRYKYPRSYKMVFPNTEANRKLIANR